MYTYSQKTGVLLWNGCFMGCGYSGAPAGKNNPAMQNVKDVGPIPRGKYTIGPAFDAPVQGPVTMRLAPDPANEMFGRGGFLIHGDTEPPGFASLGCIILPHAIRAAIATNRDDELLVTE